MKVLFIDNFDSFTYNLVDEFEKRGCEVLVYRNNIDMKIIDEVVKSGVKLIVISPGPSSPSEAGNSIKIIKKYHNKVAIFGVCLGMQAMVEAFGGKVGKCSETLHGKPSIIEHDGVGVFNSIPDEFQVGRYHSLCALKVPTDMKVTAKTSDGIVMGVSYGSTYGVQFHPESVLTPLGGKMIENIIEEVKMIKEAITKVIDKKDLSEDEAYEVMDEIMSGAATDAQIAGFLVALREKGETVEEITACAKVMREKASLIKPKGQDKCVDIVGTGGDKSGTFNISTVTSFVVAGAGIPVAKHGNKSVSSKSGSADVLERLGVKVDLEPDQVEDCISEIGIGFMYAIKFHSAMKYAIGPRKQLGVRTVFNILGPLTNPALAPYELMGVFSEELVVPLAKVLLKLGVKHAMVVHGNGTDEIALTGKTKVAEVVDGQVKEYEISPEDYGMKIVDISEILGGDPVFNAEIAKSILSGKEKGAKRDVVLLNAGAAIYVAGCAKSIEEGIKKAAESIDKGMALKKLEEMVTFTNK